MYDVQDTRGPGRRDMAQYLVDGEIAGTVHRSVLNRAADLADRLGCPRAGRLRDLTVSFEGTDVPRLRRDLEQVIAFADAARRTGWELGGLAAAPADEAVCVLDTPGGRVWVHPVFGFEVHDGTGVRRITELAEEPGTVRRAPLAGLIAPVAEAAARAGVFEVREAGSESP